MGFEDHVVDETAPVGENVQKKPKLNFVDAAASSMGTDTRDFYPVSSGLPSDLVRDAIRFTDSKQVLFPSEKGRLKAIIGERPLVESLGAQGENKLKQFCADEHCCWWRAFIACGHWGRTQDQWQGTIHERGQELRGRFLQSGAWHQAVISCQALVGAVESPSRFMWSWTCDDGWGVTGHGGQLRHGGP